MSQIRITDERLEAALKGAADTVMVHGSDGRLMGVFTPLSSPSLQPQISDEELRRREEDVNAKTYTTEEVLAKLRAL